NLRSGLCTSERVRGRGCTVRHRMVKHSRTRSEDGDHVAAFGRVRLRVLGRVLIQYSAPRRNGSVFRKDTRGRGDNSHRGVGGSRGGLDYKSLQAGSGRGRHYEIQLRRPYKKKRAIYTVQRDSHTAQRLGQRITGRRCGAYASPGTEGSGP